MATQPLDRETIHERTVALPLAEQGEVISDEQVVLAFFEELRQNGSSIPEHLTALSRELTDEMVEKIGDRLPVEILRGIVARAVRAGAAQVVSDTGLVALDIEQFRGVIDIDLSPPEEAA